MTVNSALWYINTKIYYEEHLQTGWQWMSLQAWLAVFARLGCFLVNMQAATLLSNCRARYEHFTIFGILWKVKQQTYRRGWNYDLQQACNGECSTEVQEIFPLLGSWQMGKKFLQSHILFCKYLRSLLAAVGFSDQARVFRIWIF